MSSLYYFADIRMPTEKAHGIHIMSMCDAFAKQGVKVTLVVPKRVNNLTADPFEYYGIDRSFTIEYLQSPDMRRLPYIGYVLSMMLFYWKAARTSTKGGMALLYSRDIFAGLFLANCILEVHILPKRIGLLYRYILRRSRGVVVLNRYAQEQVRSTGLDGGKVVVAPDAVDLQKFSIQLSREEARSKLGLPLAQKIVVYSGHLYEWKGAGVLAQAAAVLPDTYRVIFIGGTDADVEHFRMRYGHIPQVVIVGRKRHDDIPIYLRAADCAVVPNSGTSRVSAYYTSPMKIFEYMAAGVPIVASDLPSLRSIIDNHTAYLCKPDNPEALAESIKHTIDDTKGAVVRTQAALHRVQEYTWSNRARLILAQQTQ